MSMGEKSRDSRAGSQKSGHPADVTATPPGAPGAGQRAPAALTGGLASQAAWALGTAAATTPGGAAAAGSLDIARDSDVPISTQLYWQLAYQIDTGRLHPGARLPTVRELGAVLRVNPNTVRSVYHRLSGAGYVVSRQGAGTRVAARPPVRRTTGTLDGLVAELLRTAARAGYSADDVAAAVYAVATERRRPGPRVHVLFVECTATDARRAADRISSAFEGVAEADGALIDTVVERLERSHYDLVATSTFHADETVALVAGRAPVIALMAAPSYAELLDEIRALPSGSTVGMVCSSSRSTANMEDWLARSGGGTRLIEAVAGDEAALGRVDREADLLLLTREALEIGLAPRFGRPERIREWTYDLDPAGIELLRIAIDHVRTARAAEAAM
jgi:DNA-binding transcriptional regulator YhcF (GntR family)